jgi:outer membrane protein
MNMTRKLTFFTALLAAVSLAGAADLKVAVVDMVRVLKVYPEKKAADELLSKQVEEYEAEQKGMVADLEKAKKEFEALRDDAKNKAFSQEVRDKKSEEAETKFGELREKDRKIRETMAERQKQLSDERMRVGKRILTKLREIVGEYAKKQGYTLVIDSSGSDSGVGSVVYHAEKMDITEEIVKLVAPSAKQ